MAIDAYIGGNDFSDGIYMAAMDVKEGEMTLIGAVDEGAQLRRVVFGSANEPAILLVRNFGQIGVDQCFEQYNDLMVANGAKMPDEVLFSNN